MFNIANIKSCKSKLATNSHPFVSVFCPNDDIYSISELQVEWILSYWNYVAWVVIYRITYIREFSLKFITETLQLWVWAVSWRMTYNKGSDTTLVTSPGQLFPPLFFHFLKSTQHWSYQLPLRQRVVIRDLLRGLNKPVNSSVRTTDSIRCRRACKNFFVSWRTSVSWEIPERFCMYDM